MGEFFFGVTSDVLWDVGMSFRILIKKLNTSTSLAWKPRDEFIKPN
jgi:hypothetical protein